MKVSISATQNCNSATSKPLFQAPNFTPINNSNPCYEPTSVLELQSSPSPAAKAAATKATDTGADIKPRPHSTDLDNLEGWDSILSELGLNDDSNPNSKIWPSQISSSDSHLPQLPDFPTSQPLDHNPDTDYPISDFSHPNFGSFDLHQPYLGTNFELDFIDDLIRASQAFETNESQEAQLILARLNQRLRSPAGKPLHRTAFYFKEALQHLVSGHALLPTRLSSYEVVQSIRAHKAFAGISPISLFSTFAANQAILEAVDGSPAFIHIVDFDVGFGGHWASFMRDLVDKADPTRINSIGLRITAIVSDDFDIESKLVRENLWQFARDLDISFHMEYVFLQSFENMSFKSIKFIEGEKLAVHLSPTVFHRLDNSSQGGISKFLADLRGISPSIAVLVDREVGIEVGPSPFSAKFVAGIEFYAGLLESLDVTTGGGGDAVRRIETFVIRPRITAAVRAAAGKSITWRESFAAGRMRALGFSRFAEFQAECLLRRAQVGGFHVAKRHGELLLCWHDRALVSTSAWRC